MWDEQETPVRAIIGDVVSQHYNVYSGGGSGAGVGWAALEEAVSSLGESVGEGGPSGAGDMMMTMAAVDALREVLHDEIAQVSHCSCR